MTNSKRKAPPEHDPPLPPRAGHRGPAVHDGYAGDRHRAVPAQLHGRRSDKYLSQICDSVAAGYKAQPTPIAAVTLANLLPESDTSLRA